MKWVFDGSLYMKMVVKFYVFDLLKKFKYDCYVFCILF